MLTRKQLQKKREAHNLSRKRKRPKRRNKTKDERHMNRLQGRAEHDLKRGRANLSYIFAKLAQKITGDKKKHVAQDR